MELGVDLLDAERVLAHGEGAQRVYRLAERAGERPAEIGDADPLGPVLGRQLQGDEGPGCLGVLRHVGKRLVGGQLHDSRADAGDLHGRLLRLVFP